MEVTHPMPRTSVTRGPHRRQVLHQTLMGVTAWVLASPKAWAQQPLRVGISKFVSHAALDADETGFVAAMTAAGFREGSNVTYIRRNAQGSPQEAVDIARGFVRDGVDLIYAIATPSAQAAVQATNRIPVVFSSVTDPVRAGIVPPKSAQGQATGTHATGVSDQWPVALQLQTYARMVPQARVWGTIYNPEETNSVVHIEIMRAAAERLGLQLVEAHIRHRDEVERVALDLAARVQAMTITSDNTTVSNLEALVKVCEQRRIPLFAGDVDSVQRGAVAAFGMDYFLVGYASGKKAALVLKGIAPGTIPWGPVDKFSLVINQRAARTMGVPLAPETLAKADKVLP